MVASDGSSFKGCRASAIVRDTCHAVARRDSVYKDGTQAMVDYINSFYTDTHIQMGKLSSKASLEDMVLLNT